ncbi:MAG: very short patch repair endonuclease [Bryobacterales bacterium]|nr:very short patch repair endonuclease [Bryobacterales bacterium]
MLPDGSSRNASIELKNIDKRYRIYAYLRYSIHGKTVSRYIGQVNQSSRSENLRQAWLLAHDRRLLAPESTQEDQ